MSDTEPQAEPAAEVDAPPEETAPVEDTGPVQDLPPVPDLIGPDAALREAVASADVQPGQTVTTTTAGEAIVTGVPAPDGLPDAAATLDVSGALTAVKTPIGTVAVGYEQDGQGTSRVIVTTFPAEPDFGVESDVVVLRQIAT